MDVNQPLSLLGGLSPQQFMRRHWQKRPLLVRQAFAQTTPVVDRTALFALAAREDVESRLVEHAGPATDHSPWSLRQGPFARKSLPALRQPRWTLLVQGADLHVPAAHALLSQFRFVPDARLDDLMISYASDGGGVGPHFDSYDVFLLQTQGRRRWRIGRQHDLTLRDDVPLKILANFLPEQEWLLEPGDLLYLPPRYAHEGVAVGGDCMTCSVGFRAPSDTELAAQLLERLAQDAADAPSDRRYADPAQAAVSEPAAIPAQLAQFARQALARAQQTPRVQGQILGELLTEPKPQVWFERVRVSRLPAQVRLDRRTRMMYDTHHVFINGESFRASGQDARLMRLLANQRCLSREALKLASPAARALLLDWLQAGWLQAD